MAQPRLPQLYVECRITHQQAEPSRVDVHEPEAPELGFELQNAAGAAFHDTKAVRGLSWTINQEVCAQHACPAAQIILPSQGVAVQ